jgi:hypothetical protein
LAIASVLCTKRTRPVIKTKARAEVLHKHILVSDEVIRANNDNYFNKEGAILMGSWCFE